jgi:hypothetical protein
MLFVLLALSLATADRVVMPWMCLQRCNENITADEKSLYEQATADPRVFSALSFEDYNLGSAANLIDNGTFAIRASLIRKRLHGREYVDQVYSKPASTADVSDDHQRKHKQRSHAD